MESVCDARKTAFIGRKDSGAMAKITFKRSGGFIGKGMRFELNLNSLPISAVRTITRLVEEAQFFELPENMIKTFKPDEYQYTITVDAGITNHTVRTNDSTMPSSLRPLIRELSLLGAAHQEVKQVNQVNMEGSQ